MSKRPTALSLALLATTLAAQAGPPFAPERTFPDTTNRIGVFVDQLGNLTPAQQQFAASHYAGTQKQTTNLIDAIRQYNPNFIMIQYRLGLRDSGDQVSFIHNNTWTSDWYTDICPTANPSLHEDWFVHYDGINDPAHRLYQQYGSVKEWIMDCGGLINGNTSNGWKQFWVNATLADMNSSHADGLFADGSLLPWAPNSANSHVGAAPCLNCMDDMAAWYSYVYQQYTAANKYFIPNIGGLCTTVDTSTCYYTDVHGAMEEGYATKTSDWKMQQNRTLQLINNDKVWIAQNGVSGAGDIANRKWYLGNYLLLKGSHSYINMFPNSGSQCYWWPEYDLDLGAATDALPTNVDTYKLANGLYLRHYRNGFVLVNPTGSAKTYTFVSGDPQYLVGMSGGGDIDANGNMPAGSVTYTLQTTSVSVPAWGGQILMVPEPATLGLLTLAGLVLLKRMRKH